MAMVPLLASSCFEGRHCIITQRQPSLPMQQHSEACSLLQTMILDCMRSMLTWDAARILDVYRS